MVVFQAAVRNLSMEQTLFDGLCNVLCKENGGTDYRSVENFDGSTEKPFWLSSAYTARSQMILDVVLENVRGDIEDFCAEHALDVCQVEVLITPCM